MTAHSLFLFARKTRSVKENPMSMKSLAASLLLLGLAAAPAAAQDKGTLNPQPLPPLNHAKESTI